MKILTNDEILKKIDVKIGLYSAVRIGNNAGKRPVKVVCTSHWDKRMVYAKRIALKNAGYENIFINEDISKVQSEVFFHAWKAKQQKLVGSTCTQNGSIHVKMENGDVLLIPSVERLMKMVPLYKPPKTPSNST